MHAHMCMQACIACHVVSTPAHDHHRNAAVMTTVARAQSWTLQAWTQPPGAQYSVSRQKCSQHAHNHADHLCRFTCKREQVPCRVFPKQVPYRVALSGTRPILRVRRKCAMCEQQCVTMIAASQICFCLIGFDPHRSSDCEVQPALLLGHASPFLLLRAGSRRFVASYVTCAQRASRAESHKPPPSPTLPRI